MHLNDRLPLAAGEQAIASVQDPFALAKVRFFVLSEALLDLSTLAMRADSSGSETQVTSVVWEAEDATAGTQLRSGAGLPYGLCRQRAPD